MDASVSLPATAQTIFRPTIPPFDNFPEATFSLALRNDLLPLFLDARSAAGIRYSWTRGYSRGSVSPP